MIPATTRGWFLMPLPPTKFAPAKLAHLKVRDGQIVSGFARERYLHAPDVVPRRLHWAEGVGSWMEVA